MCTMNSVHYKFDFFDYSRRLSRWEHRVPMSPLPRKRSPSVSLGRRSAKKRRHRVEGSSEAKGGRKGLRPPGIRR
ncbi:hypothetical protein CDAR_36651 [Caerostris darwini]|uniref:Uncharacterized protein n=1 Tax=Caerostris darwini TaxID=1538125 RepID=A0AAV4UUX9_9ARAC|nr:hypothetical protein CDAR_36651 [Caerostris darwini]